LNLLGEIVKQAFIQIRYHVVVD